jgi:hypothetical protein
MSQVSVSVSVCLRVCVSVSVSVFVCLCLRMCLCVCLCAVGQRQADLCVHHSTGWSWRRQHLSRLHLRHHLAPTQGGGAYVCMPVGCQWRCVWRASAGKRVFASCHALLRNGQATCACGGWPPENWSRRTSRRLLTARCAVCTTVHHAAWAGVCVGVCLFTFSEDRWGGGMLQCPGSIRLPMRMWRCLHATLGLFYASGVAWW